MPCFTYCSISSIFIFAAAYMFMTTLRFHVPYDYSSEEIQYKHHKIAKERSCIYMKGYIYGLILSLAVMYGLKGKDKLKSVQQQSCFVSGITMIFSILYYKLVPKSDYMVRHLVTQADRELYVYIYRKMQVRYYTGILLGFLAALFLPAGLCNGNKMLSGK